MSTGTRPPTAGRSGGSGVEYVDVVGRLDRGRSRRRRGSDSTYAPLAGGEPDKPADRVLELGRARHEGAARVEHPSAREKVAGLRARRTEVLNGDGNWIDIYPRFDGRNRAGVKRLGRQRRQVVGRGHDKVTARLESPGQGPGADMADPETPSAERTASQGEHGWAYRRMRSIPGRLFNHGGETTPRAVSSVTGLGVVLTSAPPTIASCPALELPPLPAPARHDEPIAQVVAERPVRRGKMAHESGIRMDHASSPIGG